MDEGIDLDQKKAFHLYKRSQLHEQIEKMQPHGNLERLSVPCDTYYRCVIYHKNGKLEEAIQESQSIIEVLTAEVENIKGERHRLRNHVMQLLERSMSKEEKESVMNAIKTDLEIQYRDKEIENLKKEIEVAKIECEHEVTGWKNLADCINSYATDVEEKLQNERKARTIEFSHLPKIQMGTL